MKRRLRPGASEVFELLVPCELVAEKRHTISVRLHDDNRVTFEKLCDRRTAASVDLLSTDLICCYHTATLLVESILERFDKADIQVCETCVAYVALGPRPHCPLFTDRLHALRLATVPWWERIVRTGRVRRP